VRHGKRTHKRGQWLTCPDSTRIQWGCMGKDSKGLATLTPETCMQGAGGGWEGGKEEGGKGEIAYPFIRPTLVREHRGARLA
jgi:hypothetical protein